MQVPNLTSATPITQHAFVYCVDSTPQAPLLSLVFISNCLGSQTTVALKRAHADVTIPQVTNWAFARRPALQVEQTISLIPTYHVTESASSYVPTASITLQLAPVPLLDQR